MSYSRIWTITFDLCIKCPPTYGVKFKSFGFRKKARHDSEEQSYVTSKATSLLSSEMEELGGVVYRPRTKETRATYELMLSFIQQSIGDQVCVRVRTREREIVKREEAGNVCDPQVKCLLYFMTAKGYPVWCGRWSACHIEGWTFEGERETESDCVSFGSTGRWEVCLAFWPG